MRERERERGASSYGRKKKACGEKKELLSAGLGGERGERGERRGGNNREAIKRRSSKDVRDVTGRPSYSKKKHSKTKMK